MTTINGNHIDNISLKGPMGLEYLITYICVTYIQAKSRQIFHIDGIRVWHDFPIYLSMKIQAVRLGSVNNNSVPMVVEGDVRPPLQGPRGS